MRHSLANISFVSMIGLVAFYGWAVSPSIEEVTRTEFKIVQADDSCEGFVSTPGSVVEFSELEAFDFFREHSDEKEKLVDLLFDFLNRVLPKTRPMDFLDIGPGDGSLVFMLLERLASLNHAADVSLVEPNRTLGNAAVAKLRPLSIAPVVLLHRSPEMFQKTYDVILASHVLYYVEDVVEEIWKLYAHLGKSGVFLATLSDENSDITKLGQYYRVVAGKPKKPGLRTSAQIRVALSEIGLPYGIKTVRSRLRFPDTVENRRMMLHFVLQRPYPRHHERALFKFIDEHYAKGNEIAMNLSDTLFVAHRF